MNILFKMDTFKYLVSRGIKGIWKNIMPVITSVITMTICILLFGIVSAICMNLQAASVNMAANVTISAFMNEGVSDERLVDIGNEIRANEYTDTAVYITDEQTWEAYKRDYFDGKEELAESFKDDNPLAGSGHFDIHMHDISKQSEFVSYLESIPEIRQVNQSQQVALVFTDMNKIIILFFVTIVFLLSVISVFLIQNAVNTSISMRNIEISIMKSVGATELFIQFPFVVEGIVMGIFGSAIPLLLFYVVYRKAMAYVNMRFETLRNLLDFVPEGKIFHILIPASLCMGIGMGLVGSISIIHRKVSKMQ